MTNNRYKTGLLMLLFTFTVSCDSATTSNSPELPEPELTSPEPDIEPEPELTLSESLIGAWILSYYYKDSFSPQEQTGRIEEIIPDETDYGIEFNDDPRKIVLSGFLRYSVQSYEIVDNKKVIKSENTNFMDSEHGEGFHVNDWRIENELLITEDPTGDDGDPYISKSAVELSNDTLKLTLESSQFNSNQSGEIILEYKRK